jgi:hypothetical protein
MYIKLLNYTETETSNCGRIFNVSGLYLSNRLNRSIVNVRAVNLLNFYNYHDNFIFNLNKYFG